MVPIRRLVRVLVGGALLLGAGAACAEDIEALVTALAASGFDGKIAAAEALAATGDERAGGALQAMLDGRLYLRTDDGAVVVADKAGGGYALTDPLSGAALGAAEAKALDKIKVNNRLRGTLRAAIGRLTLMSPDRAKRMAAADAVFKKPDDSGLALLADALAAEADAAVRARLERALAAGRLALSKEPAARIAAVETLAGFTDSDSRALVASLLVARDDGSFAEPDAEVRAAAAAALARIEARIERWQLLGSLFQGASLGSVLLLAAIGLAITFGVMGVINMAHGEMVMLGAYTTFVVQELFRAYLPGAFGWSLAVAVPAAFVLVGAFGVAVERGLIRFLYGRPLETLLATWGLSLVLQQFVRSVFGPTNREVGNPSWMTGAIDLAGAVVLTYNRIWIIAFALAVFALLLLVIARTPFGLRMRAVTQNRAMAASMGIRTGMIDALTFGLGCGVAGIAGVALSQIDNVSPNLGRGYIVDSFMVVVFGGVGNLWGTLVGALTLGVVNKFLEPLAGAVLGKIFVLVAIILFIQKRPRGMFALRGRAAEA
ncbi:MAG TPA: urea ABC transporter permease subunit UrtB [Alphaproteobacteria bacterium]